MAYKIVALFLFAIFFSSCRSNSERTLAVEHVTDLHSDAMGSYLTKDNFGNPVLCWTELNREDSLYRLHYAVYDTVNRRFLDPIVVSGSEGSSTASESMGKVAFKSDGTVIAIFNKPFHDSNNRFASAIYYTLSVDKGKTWAQPQYIHSEHSTDYGRSFFSITTLADGEVGAIWLDGRFGESEKGSALFFSRTVKGNGFGSDVCLDKSTCECCRTAILNDPSGGLHIAYRGIQFPFEDLGEQVRDMVYSYSSDTGKTFTSAQVISHDNWAIAACPHTGPALAYADDRLNVVWFTGGGIPGLYLNSTEAGHSFQSKSQISLKGRHPQMVATKEDGLAIIWDETIMLSDSIHHDSDDKHRSNRTASHIILTLYRDGKIETQIPLSAKLAVAHHPVLISIEAGLLAAWVEQAEHGSRIAYSFIDYNRRF